jgi:hypothetical protein
MMKRRPAGLRGRVEPASKRTDRPTGGLQQIVSGRGGGEEGNKTTQAAPFSHAEGHHKRNAGAMAQPFSPSKRAPGNRKLRRHVECARAAATRLMQSKADIVTSGLCEPLVYHEQP